MKAICELGHGQVRVVVESWWLGDIEKKGHVFFKMLKYHRDGAIAAGFGCSQESKELCGGHCTYSRCVVPPGGLHPIPTDPPTPHDPACPGPSP